MLVPVFGGSYDTNDGSWPAPMALTAGAPTQATGEMTLEVNGPLARALRASLSVGPRYAYSARLGLTVGSTAANRATARAAHTIRGERLYPVRGSLTVAPPALHWPARGGMTVVTSGTIRGVGRGGLVVSGATFVRGPRHNMTVRALRADTGRMALEIVQAGRRYVSRGGITVGAGQEGLGRQSVDVAELDGFFILADVVSGELSNPLPGAGHFYPYQDITARLRVGGVEVPISGFDYQAPPDKLGASLNLQLTNVANLDEVPVWAVVDFDLLLADYTGAVHTVSLVGHGKIGGRDYTIQFSRDELTVSGIDPLADVFGLAPRVPVVMFDPNKVQYSSVEVRPRDAVLTERGETILPLLEPVEGLTWRAAAMRAYTSGGGAFTHLRPALRSRLFNVLRLIDGTASAATTGLGFARMITNIPDFPISRADFTLEGGWHDGVQPCVGMYNPVYFVETVGGQTQLFVIDSRRALPYAYAAYPLALSQYSVLGQSVPFRDPFNAVLLTYQERDADGIRWAEIWLPDEVQKEGQYGELGYQETTTRQKVLQAYDEFGVPTGDPTPTFYQQQVRAPFPLPDGSAGPLILVHEETQQDFYDDFFKVGHHKEVRTLVTSGLTASLELVTALTEDCAISWRDDPTNPGQKIQARSHTLIEGLIYVSTETSSRLNAATGEQEDAENRYPALLAEASGLITDDGSMVFGPIKSIDETLRAVRANQVDVMVVERDLIRGNTKRSVSQPRVSSGLLNKYSARSRTVLLRDTTSELEIGPRKPQAVNAGELPRALALELGRRILREGSNPLLQFRIQLPGVDLSLRRGSVVRARNRAGEWTPNVMVTGLGIAGRNLGQTGHRISLSLEATELRAAETRYYGYPVLGP